MVNEIETVNRKVSPKKIVGIDLGIKDLVITSDGEKYSNPKEINRYEKKNQKALKKTFKRRKR